jgi:hypothetical protein
MVRLVRFSEGGEVRVGAQLGDGGDIADVTKVYTPPLLLMFAMYGRSGSV